MKITATDTFSDKRGNQGEADVIIVYFRRNTTPPIQWDRVRDSDVIDIADRKFVHPSLGN